MNINAVLCPLEGAQGLIVPACDGKATIVGANQIFTSYFDTDFKKLGLDRPSPATPAVTVNVYELVKDAGYRTIFDSLSSQTNRLCLTQSQIVEYVKLNLNLLRQDGYATLFLFEKDKYFFVADVDQYDGMRVIVRRFEYDDVWRAAYRNRVVAPQL